MYKNTSKFLHHEGCPECGSSDAVAVYSDGGKYCFACETYLGTRNNEEMSELEVISKKKIVNTDRKTSKELWKDAEYLPIIDRRLSLSTIKKYNVKVDTDDIGDITHHYYPYYSKEGKMIGFKRRTVEGKEFTTFGNMKIPSLFGMQAFPAGSNKYLTITEGECFKGDVEVLTETGWIRFDEWSGQKVLQVNEDLTSNFVTPVAKIEKEYAGELISHSTRGWSITSTPEHNLVSFTQAGRLFKHPAHTYKKWHNITRVTKHSGSGINLTDDQLAFCIAVSADASFQERKNGSVYVRISFKKERKIERFRQLLGYTGVEATEGLHASGQTCFCFTLPEWCIQRKLPFEWIAESTVSQKDFILSELSFWDGNSVTNRNQTEYSSKEFHNVSFVQALAHTHGFCSTIIKRKNEYGEWYKVSLLHGKKYSSWQSVKTESQYYEGKVYCLQVPSGMLLVRHNNHVSVVGNCDAMSVYEMSGGQSAAISVKSSSSFKKDLADKAIYDYVDSFENIVLCLDNDKVGKKATEELVELFDPRKIKIVQLEAGFKDPSDYLQANKQSQFTKLWWKAKPYAPEGIINSSELKGSLLNTSKPECFDTCWEGLNNVSYGMRGSEMWTWIADTGIGKSAVFYELIMHYLQTTDYNIGIIALEAPIREEVLPHLASVYLSKPIYLPDVECTEEELREADEYLCDENARLFFMDDGFGSIDISTLLKRIRFMVKVLGCKIIFLDHISMITSDQRYADERKALDEVSTKLKTMTVETGMCLNVVAHTNRQGEIRGTANIEKLSNLIFRLERDKKHKDEYKRNLTYVTCEKNRFAGKTGPTCCLHYDSSTGRLNEVEWVDPEDDDSSISDDDKFW